MQAHRAGVQPQRLLGLPGAALIRPRTGSLRAAQLYGSFSLRGSSRWRRGSSCLAAAAAQPGPGPAGKGSLLPAGKRQARVTIPALFLTASAEEIAGSKAALEELGAAVSGGATAVVLYEGAEGGASQLYEAALQVRELLRGRAALLIADRTDIAPAAEADGALLSPQVRGGAGKRLLAGWGWGPAGGCAVQHHLLLLGARCNHLGMGACPNRAHSG